MADIILVTHWTGGDVFPIITLGNILVNRNHHVTILTHCYYKDIAHQHNLKFCAIDTPEEFEQMNNDLHMLANPVKDTQATIYFNKKYHGKDKLLHEVEKIKSICTRKKKTIIIGRHRSSVSSLLAAEVLGLPYASIVLAPNYLDHMNLHNEIFGENMTEEINKARQTLQLAPISDWKDWLYCPKKIFGIWPEWFAKPEENWPSSLVPIGFLQKKHHNSDDVNDILKPVIHSGKKIALITAGTSKMINPDFFKVAATACSKVNCKAILLLRHDELCPETLPGNIIRIKKADLGYLMTKANVIIHHGGIGTLSEAIMAGIPQIILPHLTDGPDNAFRIQNLGLGKLFPILRWDAAKIAETLDDMLFKNNYKNVALYSQKLKMEQDNQNWIHLIEEMENPAANMEKRLKQLENKKEIRRIAT